MIKNEFHIVILKIKLPMCNVTCQYERKFSLDILNIYDLTNLFQINIHLLIPEMMSLKIKESRACRKTSPIMSHLEPNFL